MPFDPPSPSSLADGGVPFSRLQLAAAGFFRSCSFPEWGIPFHTDGGLSDYRGDILTISFVVVFFPLSPGGVASLNYLLVAPFPFAFIDFFPIGFGTYELFVFPPSFFPIFFTFLPSL